MSYLGVILALVALFAWGFGDFFIQRSARAVGIWEALFLICLFGAVVLLPWALPGLVALQASDWLLLLLLSVVLLLAALFDFAALKEGKLAIVEPIWGLEMPLAVVLGMVFVAERPSSWQLILILLIFIGIILAVTTKQHYWLFRRRWLEKGAALAAIGAAGMALADFLTGLASRQTSGVLAMWFVNVFIAVVCLIYLLANRRLGILYQGVKKNSRTILGQCVFDNIAWVAYASSMMFIPIGIATAISESYIILTILLGIFVNREKLGRHQLAGAALATGGVVMLSVITAVNGLY